LRALPVGGGFDHGLLAGNQIFRDDSA
jgi:hypothetical protein